MKKKAIIVASFGTTYHDTLEKTIAPIEQLISKTYPDAKVLRAFTSRKIKNILEKRDNIYVLNEIEALKELKAEGFLDISVQPLHFLPGIEFSKLTRLEGIKLGAPLLASDEDFKRVAIGFKDLVTSDKLYILMGHGTRHKSDDRYDKMEEAFRNEGLNNIMMATVEGRTELKDILPKIESYNIKDIVLMPFMLVCGDHAKNDMAGDDEDSWKNVLKSQGYNVICDMRGLGEFDFIRQIYLDHLKAVE
ncbi:MAG: sirohydrochlorin cobaltochelatase [Tissierellia bacterium]|nr:sirohydrochlorin cobaltochelatase [Tissierellia bacterium]